MKAIRRFTVRTVLPESLSALDELAATSAGPGTSRPGSCSTSIDPELWQESRRDPVALLGRGQPRSASRRSPPTPPSSPAPTRCATTCAPTSASRAGTRRSAGRPAHDRLLLAGVRHRGRPAAVLGRPRHPRRRPPEERLRPRPAARRRRPVLPLRLLQAGDLRRRLAAGDLPGPRPRRPAALGAPRHADGSPAPVALALPGGRTLLRPHLAGRGRPRHAAAARHRHPRERGRRCAASPTGSTAAAASTACCRSCCSASAASAPSSVWTELAGQPVAEVFHTNEGHAGLPGPRAHLRRSSPTASSFAEALQVVRAGTVFTTHTPVPAGIDRFDRGADRALLLGRPAARRRRAGTCSRSAPRTTRAAPATCSTWPSWACASASTPTASRSCTAR